MTKKGAIMQREYITGDAWIKMYKFFKQTNGIYVVTEMHLKNFIEAIYWIVRTGAQWRELPERYGHWNGVFKRFNAWSKKGIWEKLFKFFSGDPDLEYLMFDATIVRAHACAAGYGDQANEGLGRSKGGFTTKIHAKVDALGNPLKLVVTAGQVADITKAEELLGSASGSYALADKGYDSNDFRNKIKIQNCIPVIPPRSNRNEIIEYDEHIYKERNLIECFFSKIKQFRRIFSRFDKSVRSYAAFLAFVGACIWLR